MGSGKGAPDHWVAVVKPGRVLYEIQGVDEALAREAMNLAAQKAADQDQVRDACGPRGRHCLRNETERTTRSTRANDTEELKDQADALKESLFRLKFRKTLGVGEVDQRHSPRKKTLARVYTLLNKKDSEAKTAEA